MNGVFYLGENGVNDDVVTIKGLSVYYKKGTELDLCGERIKNVGNATELTDCPNLGQVISGKHNMENYRIINVSDGISDTDAVNLAQARTLVSDALFTHGVNLAQARTLVSDALNTFDTRYYRKGQDLIIGNQMIRNVHPGILGTDAVNKGQVYSLIKDRIFLKTGKLNHRVHDSLGGRYFYRIVRFDRLIRTLDKPTEENSLSDSQGGRVPSVTNIYSNRLVIPLSFFISKLNRFISPQANVSHQAWFQEPLVFAEDAYYFSDITGIYANADYMFYFIMFPGASIVEA